MKTVQKILRRMKIMLENCFSSVIRRKGESQNGGNRKTKYTKYFKNEHFLPRDTHTLLPLFWDSLFCLITDTFYVFVGWAS